jgi:hypothetical protein
MDEKLRDEVLTKTEQWAEQVLNRPFWMPLP